MPNHKSTEKSLRQNARRQERNIATKSKIRTLTKKVRKAVEAKDKEQARNHLRMAVSAIDTAAKKHVIHPSSASRRKSRLMHLVDTLPTPVAESSTASETATVSE